MSNEQNNDNATQNPTEQGLVAQSLAKFGGGAGEGTLMGALPLLSKAGREAILQTGGRAALGQVVGKFGAGISVVVTGFEVVDHISKDQNASATTSLTTGGGTVVGAALGTFFIPIPVLGTVIGSGVGALIGWGAGKFTNKATGAKDKYQAFIDLEDIEEAITTKVTEELGEGATAEQIKTIVDLRVNASVIQHQDKGWGVLDSGDEPIDYRYTDFSTDVSLASLQHNLKTFGTKEGGIRADRMAEYRGQFEDQIDALVKKGEFEGFTHPKSGEELSDFGIKKYFLKKFDSSNKYDGKNRASHLAEPAGDLGEFITNKAITSFDRPLTDQEVVDIYVQDFVRNNNFAPDELEDGDLESIKEEMQYRYPGVTFKGSAPAPNTPAPAEPETQPQKPELDIIDQIMAAIKKALAPIMAMFATENVTPQSTAANVGTNSPQNTTRTPLDESVLAAAKAAAEKINNAAKAGNELPGSGSNVSDERKPKPRTVGD